MKTPRVDLTGQTFERLTVISFVDRGKSGDARWHCRCLCGNEKVVLASNLKLGTTKSCGCLRAEKIKGPRLDLTGQTFGRLTVLELVGGTGRPKWRCRCLCGNEKVVAAVELKNGDTRSCGCLHRETARLRAISRRPLLNLTGRTFGRLTVIGFVNHVKEGGREQWHCRCLCGNEKVVLASNLKTGNTRSCGCSQAVNLAGQIFGRLTVIGFADRTDNGDGRWHCRCLCGNETVVVAGKLKNGNTRSCGCLRTQNNERNKKIKDMRRFGLSVRDIAFETGLTEANIFGILKNPGLRASNKQTTLPSASGAAIGRLRSS
jgi:hypothetical protein